ncbi:MAG TPA: D-sedoheptulose 7-phosphate isomerase [Bacteroidota bacterium]|nr:D-sedoheptulose 7-phosphate isomerase [Bacteroidota bacterium]
MDMDYIGQQLAESAAVKNKIAAECSHQIRDACDALLRAFRGGHKLLLCGNGGSAADAQHIAAEFVVRMNMAGRPALPAIALTTDSSALTAGGNDIGFENIFARQVEALGAAGDVLIAISTSGNSENIVRAAAEARKRKMVVVGFLGRGGGKLAPMTDVAVVIPSDDTQRIQEGHITVAHILCGLVERTLFG